MARAIRDLSPEWDKDSQLRYLWRKYNHPEDIDEKTATAAETN
jgi:hypothetical protein